eukprot:UN25088
MNEGGFDETELDDVDWPPKRWENMRPKWYEKRSEVNLRGKDTDIGTLNWFLPQPKESDTVGRAWRATELLRKSFEDLHKLWWVLMRERNMLETIRFQCRAEKRQMPNYSRLIKCKKSMARLKTVVNERNLVYKRNLINIALKEEEQWEAEDAARLGDQRHEERTKIKQKYGEYLQKLAQRPMPGKIDPREPSTLSPQSTSPYKYIVHRTEKQENQWFRMKKRTTAEGMKKGLK